MKNFNNKQFITRFLKEQKVFNKFRNKFINSEDTRYTMKYINKIENITKIFNIISIAFEQHKKYEIQHLMEIKYLKQKYNKTKKQIFDQFLKNYNIYENFYQNTRKCKPHNERFINQISPLYLMINDAFTWDETNEGFETWNEAHNNLQNYIVTISKNNNQNV